MGQVIGILGGSGLYDLDGLEQVRKEVVHTPYGAPSAPLVHGVLDGVNLVFLARHGLGHTLSPSAVPYRANIWALKRAGVRWLVSVSAVGSLQPGIAPGHVVLVDQFIDRTRRQPASFFTEGIVAHVSFGDPVCPVLRGCLLDAAREEGATFHDGGTYVCMEGPAFSTRAESNLYRSWGASVVGMTNLPEAKLAREAEIAYATLALVTDYDCWREGYDEVSVEQVIDTLRKNVALAKRILRRAIPAIATLEGSPAHGALKDALLTAPEAIDPRWRAKLDELVRGYLG